MKRRKYIEVVELFQCTDKHETLIASHTHHTLTEQLKSILKAYHERINSLEDKKYDVEYIVKRKDVEV